jgi:phage repressor protein C with HTH and peptisase S24 domain
MSFDKSLILNRLKTIKNLSSDRELADFLGITTQNLSNWRSRNTIDYDLLFTKCVDVDLNWILTGDVTSNGLVVNEPQAIYKRKQQAISHDPQTIPLYAMEAAAGVVNLFQHQGDEKPIDYLRIPGIPKSDGAMPITGDSMYPILKSGDLAIYKQVLDVKNAVLLWGEMYIVGFILNDDDMVSVKYVQKSEFGSDYIKLVSQNRHHEPIDIPRSSIRALAIVNAHVRYNRMG